MRTNTEATGSAWDSFSIDRQPARSATDRFQSAFASIGAWHVRRYVQTDRRCLQSNLRPKLL
ncbi:hypothetical protein POG22_19315 [Geitlerinema sp. CS-897]|nr:hypothetical protein [Geitlerinema sp. CS-897]